MLIQVMNIVYSLADREEEKEKRRKYRIQRLLLLLNDNCDAISNAIHI